MLGLPKAKALAYSQLSRYLLPPDKDTSPNFTGTAGKALGPNYSLLQTLPALQRVRFHLAPLPPYVSSVWEKHTRVKA